VTDLLKDKVAVVTCAATGLGRACAQALAEEGATVVVADVDLESARAVAGGLPSGVAAACDVRDDGQVAALVTGTMERHGTLDVMVANTGIAAVSPLLDMTLDEWRMVTSLNLDAAFSVIRHAARAMVATDGGSIVALSSVTGLAGTPLLAHYAAANAGIISLTQSAAAELRDQGVRVNVVCPGWVEGDPVLPRLEAGGLDMGAVVAQTQGRLGTPEEIARLVLFLAGDRARFCTGAVYVADRGMRASLV